MARSRSRSQSQARTRTDQGRRACQMRRFHQELQTRHSYKRELLDCFDSATLAAIDRLIDQGIDWRVVPDGETPYNSRWMQANSLKSQLVWIKRWAREAAGNQQPGDDAVNGSEQAVAVDAIDAHHLGDPSAGGGGGGGGDDEQVAVADAADKSADLLQTPSYASFSPEPVHHLLRDLQLADKTHNIDHDANTVKPNLNQAFQSVNSNEKLVRMREENRVARATYGEIPPEYRDWLLAKKEAGLRRRELDKAEKLCEAAQDKVASQQDALELEKQELERAKSLVTAAKRRRGATTGGRASTAHADAVLDRGNNEVELRTLRIERKQKAEAYNSALERCKTAATAHSSAYDAWAKARDNFRQADVLEEQRACIWERLRGVRRDSIGR
ncbi:hypothetical protein LY76DRAFT_649073 [Colletotrichum caudatum]|nr:hypothetical protein LY76DRAFT_649073 [Colletotrichum caudatum]